MNIKYKLYTEGFLQDLKGGFCRNPETHLDPPLETKVELMRFPLHHSEEPLYVGTLEWLKGANLQCM